MLISDFVHKKHPPPFLEERDIFMLFIKVYTIYFKKLKNNF
jgi:hypothetical protein